MKNKLLKFGEFFIAFAKLLFALGVGTFSVCYFYIAMYYKTTTENVLLMNVLGTLAVFFLVMFIGTTITSRLKRIEKALGITPKMKLIKVRHEEKDIDVKPEEDEKK